MEKSCGNCVNCFKGEEFWSCENSDSAMGMPVKCNPPYDEACSHWSDNPADYEKQVNALRNFVDNYWANYESDD